MGASRLIQAFETAADLEAEGAPTEPPVYRDVSRQPPRTMVAVCSDCPVVDDWLDVDALTADLARRRPSCSVVQVGALCSETGWEALQETVKAKEPNRLLLGACSPYSFIPRLKELARSVNLRPNLMDVVELASPEPVPAAEAVEAGEEPPPAEVQEPQGPPTNQRLASTLAMAVARLERADPVAHPPVTQVVDRALVVGGGLAGMTAALAIAEHDHDVCLVEQEEELGGMVKNLRTTLTGDDPQKTIRELVEQVHANPRVEVLTDSRVTVSSGAPGHFRSALETPAGMRILDHGATVLATGAVPAGYYEDGYRTFKSVLTQIELEQRLAEGEIDAVDLQCVGMILCSGSREEPRNYCSRICCSQALKNIETLLKKNHKLKIYVFYRDMMSYGFLESFYTKARQNGVQFIRYSLDNKPKVTFRDEKPVITALDPVLQEEVTARPDVLVLTPGMEPNPTAELSVVFGVERDQDGFFQEAEPKWRPTDFLKQGVFVCGTALSPRSMPETVSSAQAAAQRALRILNAESIPRNTVTAEVRHSLCTMCGRCITACAYGARTMDEETERVLVDPVLCQGCGSCAAVCPNSATILGGFHDAAMLEVIDEALLEMA
jgi:heterodisulfide reductase subunit A